MQNNKNKYLIDYSKIEVKVKRVKSGKKILAQAEIIIDEINEVKGFKIIKSLKPDKEYVVFPPSYEIKSGKFQNVWWINNRELWDEIENRIIEQYKNLEITEDCKNVFEDKSL